MVAGSINMLLQLHFVRPVVLGGSYIIFNYCGCRTYRLWEIMTEIGAERNEARFVGIEQ